MTISVPEIHSATSLNYISHLQKSISQRTNTFPEKLQPGLVKYQSVQRNQLLLLLLLVFELTLEVCANTLGGRGSIHAVLLLQPARSRQAAMQTALVVSFYTMSLLQRGGHKCNLANGALLRSEPSLQATSWRWCQRIVMACL